MNKENLPITNEIGITINKSGVNINVILTMNEAIELRNELTRNINELQEPVADYLKKVQSNTSPK